MFEFAFSTAIEVFKFHTEIPIKTWGMSITGDRNRDQLVVTGPQGSFLCAHLLRYICYQGSKHSLRNMP